MVPIATHQIHARLTPLGSRSQPKIHSPMNVASRKKASSASIARGAPKTSPPNLEYSLQFIPISNSRTMPVTTPTAKQIRKGLLQNFTILRYFDLPVRYHAVCMLAGD